MDERKKYLEQWGSLVVQNCHNGALTGDPQKPIPIGQVVAINGPRAGALELHAGLQSDKLVRIMSRSDCALLRQFIPWRFAGDPICFMSGRYVRMEAGWPDGLAEKDIKLKDLVQQPKGGGRWIAGKNELGQTVTLGLSNAVPHWLLAGTTGSGKSYAMRSAIGQFCKDPQNSLCLIDGKWGEGLGPLADIRGLVGPLATDMEMARRALSWCAREMRHRYENPDPERGRLVVVVDELQELCTQDATFAELLRKLTTQGRAARVHCILGTQHPVKEMFGNQSTTKMNIPGRLALHVLDAKASEVAIGAPQPRADHLLGTGDAYAIVPGKVHRAQLAYIPEVELGDLPHSEPVMSEWPEFDSEAAGTLPDTCNWAYTGQELGASVLAAKEDYGRRRMVEMMKGQGFDICEGDKAKRLSQLGKEAFQFLVENDFCGRVGGLAVEHTPQRGFEAFLSEEEYA